MQLIVKRAGYRNIVRQSNWCEFLKLTLSHFAFAALTAFTWMLLAFYPPWVVIGSSAAGGSATPKYFGYASIWEPPSEDSLPGAVVEVDVQRLLLQDLGALVPIAVLWMFTGPFRREMEKAEASENKYHGPEANQNLSRGLRIVLLLISFGCISSSFLLIKDHVNPSRLAPASSSAQP